MTISKLLEGLSIRNCTGSQNREIKGIAYDSRTVKKDFLFVAVKGLREDGNHYIKDALSRGAAAVVSEDTGSLESTREFAVHDNVTYVGVPDSRQALALISAAYYGHPSKRLTLAGITGTNGKTTTSFIAKSIIEEGGGKAGLLGTICYMTGNKNETAVNTTPESMNLQGYLSEMLENHMEYAVLEVSSHALALKRVEGCTFKTAAFTNFTQDHLDFHGSMDEYFNSKTKIFSYLAPDGTAVLNHDDPMIRPLAEKLDCRVITYGTGSGAMLRAENISDKTSASRDKKHDVPSGLSFELQTNTERFRVNSRLVGRFNVYNILAAAGIGYALGMSTEVVQKGISAARPVPGRFENIDEGQGFLCIVDYAHTEDALRKLINEARHVTRRKIITVFGCGGDRDRAKRPLMGAAASELSDLVVITSDNPRSEQPAKIIEDIIKGIKSTNYKVCPDREEAIREAVSLSSEGDTLIVAGKGHEDYQEINGIRHHFSDKEILKNALRERLDAR